jgi:hypothetical protein
VRDRAQPGALREGPRQKLGKGKTPVLTADEAGELLRSIGTNTVVVVGLRDRALIGVMVFTGLAWRNGRRANPQNRSWIAR